MFANSNHYMKGLWSLINNCHAKVRAEVKYVRCWTQAALNSIGYLSIIKVKQVVQVIFSTDWFSDYFSSNDSSIFRSRIALYLRMNS